MTTTAIVVDILIIGFFSLIWIFLIFLKIIPSELNSFDFVSEGIKVWITPISFGIIFICYQLGLIINWLGALLVRIIFQSKLRDSIFKDKKLDYHTVKATVDQCGSAEIHKYLNYELSIIRIVRSGVINFLLISIFSLGYYFAITMISLLFTVICIFYWYQRYRAYYFRILNIYQVIMDK